MDNDKLPAVAMMKQAKSNVLTDAQRAMRRAKRRGAHEKPVFTAG